MLKTNNQNISFWRIEIKKQTPDPEAHALLHDIQELGIKSINDVQIIRIYFIMGIQNKKDIRSVALTLLCDPVIETYIIGRFRENYKKPIEIVYNPGVMDPSAENIISALTAMGFPGCQVKTGKRYLFLGKTKREETEKVTNSLLYNPLIQHPAMRFMSLFSVHVFEICA